jgi:hypothetical protein
MLFGEGCYSLTNETLQIHEAVIQAQEWWEQSCLYLTSDARSAFQQAYLAAHDHAELLNIHADVGDLQEARETVRRARRCHPEGREPPIHRRREFINIGGIKMTSQ